MLKRSQIIRANKTNRAMLIAICAVALGTSWAPDQGAAQNTDTNDLYALIADLKSENSELKELVGYQKELRALLRVDPASVWSARRPYSECLDSVIAEYCAPFGAMYLPPLQQTEPTTSKGGE